MNKRTHGQYIPHEEALKWQKRVIIKTRTNKSVWYLVKRFINKRVEIEEKFTRKDMLTYIYPDPDVYHYMRSNNNTPDSYRHLLTQVKIVKTTDKPGVYIKLRDIPDKLTTPKLQEIAHDKSWKSWFIPLDERLDERRI